MSRTYRNSDEGEGRYPGSRPKGRRDSQDRSSGRSRRGRQRRLSVRGALRQEPDVRKIARAVIAMTSAQAEAEAQAQLTARDQHEEGDAHAS